jgi:hypothetical protein
VLGFVLQTKSTKAMESIPDSSNSMEGSIQNQSDHLNLGNGHNSDGNYPGNY